MWHAPTLLITDPNLGDHARSRMATSCADLTVECYDVGHADQGEEILDRIAAGRWALAVSFYSDLILTPEALSAIELPLNIHPALPRIRGVGYDVAPLVEQHPKVGATLHRVTESVDAGGILDVLEVPLSDGHTAASLRALNQSVSLRLLNRLCGLLDEAVDLSDLEARLAARAAEENHQWGPYYSRKTISAMRDEHAAELGVAPPANPKRTR